MTPRIITRREAGLQLPRAFSGWMRLPAPELWIHHTVTAEYNSDPAAGMRDIQQIAFSRGFNDISYSWLIFKDGTIGEGRGWGVVGAHTVGHNSIAHAFSLVGNYDTTQPSGQQIESIRYLWQLGQQLNKIARTTPMPTGGHRDTGFATACPGRFAYTKLPDMRVPYSAPKPTPTPIEDDELNVLVRTTNPDRIAVSDGSLFKRLVSVDEANQLRVRGLIKNQDPIEMRPAEFDRLKEVANL